MGSIDDVIEPKILTKAIEIVLKRKNGAYSSDVQNTAKQYSELLLNHFGYEERILDIPLDTDTRDVFYMFEDSGLISTIQEEDIVFMREDNKGKDIFKDWRTNYWILGRSNVTRIIDKENQRIKEAAKIKEIPEDVTEHYDALYEHAYNEYAMTPG